MKQLRNRLRLGVSGGRGAEQLLAPVKAAMVGARTMVVGISTSGGTMQDSRQPSSLPAGGAPSAVPIPLTEEELKMVGGGATEGAPQVFLHSAGQRPF